MSEVPSRIVLIGFHGTADGRIPVSQNELVAALLAASGYEVRAGSSEPRQVLRLVDQLRLLRANIRDADAVVVDLFSGRRSWTAVATVRIASLFAVPSVLVLHGGGLPDFARSHSWRIDATSRMASRIVAPSEHLQAAFRARGHEVRRVPNIVTPPRGESTREALDSGFRVLWMRAFDREYQPELAVSAFVELMRTDPGSSMTMAGPDRGLRDAARQLANESGVADAVTFPGYLAGPEKDRALLDHDVFLNTTCIDNTPVSVLEAMAAGLPVVTTDVGGLRVLLEDGACGTLVPDGDAPALASAIRALRADPDRKDEMVARAKRRSQAFESDAVLREWESLLDSTGARRNPAPHAGCGLLSRADLDEVVSIHLSAFPGSFMTRLGPSVVRRYYEWQFSGPHPDPLALGIWHSGRLAGFLFGGRRRGAVSGMVRRYPQTLLVGASTHPRAVGSLALPKAATVARAVFRWPAANRATGADPGTVEPPRLVEPSFGILSIAVGVEHLGTGAGQSLLGCALEMARERGYRGAHLTVAPTNTRAIRFYERSGFKALEGEGGLMSRSLDQR